MNQFITTFKELYNFYMLFLFVAIGLFLLFKDVPFLGKKKLHREMKLAKVMGYCYIVGGVALFVIAKLIK